MGSMLFVGVFIGSLITGFLTDEIGRKRSLTYVSFIQFFLGMYSAFIHNETIFIIVRGLFGVVLGFGAPLVYALAAEWTPIDKRGKVLVMVTSVFSVGQVTAIIIAAFCLENLGSGNWRLMLFLCSFPSLVVWFGSVNFLRDSPRFVMINESIEAGMEILNYVVKFNKQSDNNLFHAEKDMKDFHEWRDFMREEFLMDHKKEKFFMIRKLKEIFQPKYWKITIGLWAAWFSITFSSYGLIFILPFFLDVLDQQSILSHEKQHGILIMLLTTLSEALSGILAYLFVEKPKFGKKNSLAWGQLITGICAFIAFAITIHDSVIMICIFSVARFFAQICFNFIYPLTAEIYPTMYRTMGLGCASAFGRLSTCALPFILIKMFYVNIYLPFLMIFIVSFAGMFGTWLIPHDTQLASFWILEKRTILSIKKWKWKIDKNY